jgi:hypothetical protein
MREGLGAMRLTLDALPPPLDAGLHHLHYRNTHRPDIGVYLANALVPANAAVTITAQRRDVDQRDLTIDFTVSGDRRGPRVGVWVTAMAAIGLVIVAGVRTRRGVGSGGH